MLRLAALALILSCAAAQHLPGTKVDDMWNEMNKDNIQLFKECDDIEQFEPKILGWWAGRKQIDSKSWHFEYDIHNVLKDGSGIVNARSEKDHDKIARETPTKMWCKQHKNGVDKTLKVQYGPTRYGQLVCIDLSIPYGESDEMVISVNQALFTDARIPMKFPVALDCLNYPYQSKYNSFTIWADQLYAPSYSKWYRTTEPKGSDWVPDDKKKSSDLLALLRLLAKDK